jgi:hypothetical protein
MFFHSATSASLCATQTTVNTANKHRCWELITRGVETLEVVRKSHVSITTSMLELQLNENMLFLGKVDGSLSISLPLYLSLYFSFSLALSFNIYIYIYIYLSLSVSLSFSLIICLSISFCQLSCQSSVLHLSAEM